MKLTKTEIDAASYNGKGQDIRWCSELTGFGLRIYPSGKKAFVVSYRYQGRFHIMSLGKYGELTPHQARSLARDNLAKVRLGEDPLKKRRDDYHTWTVRQFCDEFLTRHAASKKSYKAIKRRVRNVIEARFGAFKLTEVTRSKVSALHDEIGAKHPYEANRILALWSVFYEKAKEWGRYPEHLPNPGKRIQKKPEKSRERFVTEDEMPRLLASIREEQSPYVRSAIWMYLLTGFRVHELLGLQWSQVDLKEGVIHLKDTKAGRSHDLPLSAPAVDILKGVPKQLRNPYVFCGTVQGTRIADLRDHWERILERANITGLQKRDLRRTVGSWLVQSGESLPMIGKVLNHSQTSTTKIYARFALEPVRQTLEKHAQRIIPFGEM